MLKLKNPSLLRNTCPIAGNWIGADAKEAIKVLNPADNSLVGTVPGLGAEETQRAIDAAEAAFKPWAARAARERTAILRRWFELMLANADDLAALMTAEQGKPLAEAKGEVRLCRLLHRMVRGRGQARLWRDHSGADRGYAH